MYQYQKAIVNGVMQVFVTPMPEWDDFSDFVSWFISREKGTIIEQDYGMDRHQIRYQVGEQRNILQFEHYTNSIWIETDY